MKPFIYIIFICLILSCSESRESRMALQRAVSVTNVAPDSALHILDSLKEHEQRFGRQASGKLLEELLVLSLEERH